MALDFSLYCDKVIILSYNNLKEEAQQRKKHEGWDDDTILKQSLRGTQLVEEEIEGKS